MRRGVADRIRRRVRMSRLDHRPQHIRVRLTIGVALVRPGESIPDLLLPRADTAMVRAKRAGGDRTALG